MQINLLGQLEIKPRLAKVPRKAKALLAYVSVHNRPITRDRLADLLWPYQGAEQARHSLRNCLLQIRKSPANPFLQAEFANVGLVNANTDIEQFKVLVCSNDKNDLILAERLYRGNFLADFEIQSEPFEEWLQLQRLSMELLICKILPDLSSMHTADGNHLEALRVALRLVEIDPLSEAGHRAVMNAYGMAGRRPQALRQYRHCAEILKRELGIEPCEETKSLANYVAKMSYQRVPDKAPAETLQSSDIKAQIEMLRIQLSRLLLRLDELESTKSDQGDIAA